MTTKNCATICLSQFVVIMIFLAGLNTPAWSWSDDPTVNTAISSGIGTNHFLPQITDDGSGGAIITWFDGRNGNYDIFSQRVDADGAVQWAANGVVICNAANTQWYPEIVSDGSGGAIIIWRDHRSGASSDIFAQKINANGAVQWTPNGVSLTSGLYTNEPQMTADGSGGAIITWNDYRDGNSNIYAQRVNSAGVAQWTANGIVISAAANTQDYPQIIADGSGGAIIAWFDGRDGNSNIYAQRVNTSGIIQWTANGVAIVSDFYNGGSRVPQLVTDGSGGAIFVWDHWASGNGWNIYMQRAEGSAGALQWGTSGVTITDILTSDQEYPYIASDGAGGTYITWEDSRNYVSSNWDIYAQRINATGTPQWTANGIVISDATNSQRKPQIVADGGSAVFTWGDSRSGNADIYLQRVDINGISQWATNGVAVSTAANTQNGFQNVADGSGGVVSVWQDDRGANADIYAQRVYVNGDLIPTFYDELAVDFGGIGKGLYHYDGSWTKLTSWDAEENLGTLNGDPAVEFVGKGLWTYDGSAWTKLTAWDVDNSGLGGWASGLAVDFGGIGKGLYNYDGSWTKLTGWDPEQNLAGWSGDLAAEFVGKGLWTWDGSAWTKLTAWDVDSGGLASWSDGLAVDFGGIGKGLYNYDGAAWTKLTSWNAESLTGWPEGLAADFEGEGLWTYDGASWTKLSNWDADGVAGVAGGLMVDFGTIGKGLHFYDGATWTKLTGWNADDMTDCDLN